MDRFVAAYENGATPNPCIDCNRYLKFNSLYHRAEELGCHYVVTGHYARIEKREDGRYLLKKQLTLQRPELCSLLSYSGAAGTHHVSTWRHE